MNTDRRKAQCSYIRCTWCGACLTHPTKDCAFPPPTVECYFGPEPAPQREMPPERCPESAQSDMEDTMDKDWLRTLPPIESDDFMPSVRVEVNRRIRGTLEDATEEARILKGIGSIQAWLHTLATLAALINAARGLVAAGPPIHADTQGRHPNRCVYCLESTHTPECPYQALATAVEAL